MIKYLFIINLLRLLLFLIDMKNFVLFFIVIIVFFLVFLQSLLLLIIIEQFVLQYGLGCYEIWFFLFDEVLDEVLFFFEVII